MQLAEFNSLVHCFLQIQKIYHDSFDFSSIGFVNSVVWHSAFNLAQVCWGCVSQSAMVPPCITCVQYRGGYLEYRGDIMSTVGVILSTAGILSTMGDISWCTWGYHEYCGGVQYCNGKVFCCLSPPRYWTPPRYSWYPPNYWTPPRYSRYPHIYHDIPHGTEHPYSTQDIPPQYWTPPQYCTPPRYCHMLYRVARCKAKSRWYGDPKLAMKISFFMSMVRPQLATLRL